MGKSDPIQLISEGYWQLHSNFSEAKHILEIIENQENYEKFTIYADSREIREIAFHILEARSLRIPPFVGEKEEKICILSSLKQWELSDQ